MHRDIKPDNLMLRPDGYVKVLDFGVATFARRPRIVRRCRRDDRAEVETGEGMIVGTIAYMSPEQARGLPVDGRSDCYSLGVVLYELVTGRAPFTAPTTTDLLVAILEREPPPIRSVARGLPLQLEWIIEKALEKDPNLRYQRIADLRVDLQRLKSALESGGSTSAARRCRRRLPMSSIERELTEDSPEVAAVSGVSWMTLAVAVAAAIVFGVAMSYYHLARPGADLPLQLPEGGVLTKARDTIQSFGYSGYGLAHERRFHQRRRRRADHGDGRAHPRPARRFARARRSRIGAPASRTPRIRRAVSTAPPAIIRFAWIRRASWSRLRRAMRPTAPSRTPIARRRRRSASRRSRKPTASTRPATSSKSSSAPSPPARPR